MDFKPGTDGRNGQMSNRLPVLAATIRSAHDSAKVAARFSAENALKAGHLLIEAKAAIGHGGWLPWLRQHVGMSERTAQGYMRLARLGMESATVADIGLRTTLTRVGRRRPKLPEILAGTYIRLVSGPEVSSELQLASPSGWIWLETELHIWSRDGRHIECLWFWAPDMSWHSKYDGQRRIIGAHYGQPSAHEEIKEKIASIIALEDFIIVKLLRGSDLAFLDAVLRELPAPTATSTVFGVGDDAS
jgi:hypothetical protein